MLPAPFAAPGGVLDTRHDALWTAAFRPLDTVGFPLDTALRDILLATTLRISGLHHAAWLLAPSSSVLPIARHARGVRYRPAGAAVGRFQEFALSARTHWGQRLPEFLGGKGAVVRCACLCTNDLLGCFHGGLFKIRFAALTHTHAGMVSRIR